MNWYEPILIITIGFIAGFINTVAGGGSLLTMPFLIFLGLPPAVANGTNRIAIVAQNIFGVAGFQSKGVSAFPYSIWLAVSSLIGAVIGAKIAVDIQDEIFNKILAVVIVVVVVFSSFNATGKAGGQEERMSFKYQLVGFITFFFIGIYGGFIQAGVGFLIMATLSGLNRYSLVKTNSAKAFIVLVYTIAALSVFIIEGKINWMYGITLAIGNSAGAWIASRWSVKKGDKWVQRILIAAVIIFAIKLWFFT